MILTYGTISKTVYDCGSVNPLPITIDEAVLEMMDGRFYYKLKGRWYYACIPNKQTHI